MGGWGGRGRRVLGRELESVAAGLRRSSWGAVELEIVERKDGREVVEHEAAEREAAGRRAMVGTA